MLVRMQSLLNFTNFYEMVKGQKLNIKTAYKLTQLARAVEIELQFYQDKMKSIINEYSLLDENGKPIQLENGEGVKIRPGTEEECYKAIFELQSIEVTLPDIQFTFEEFTNVEITVEQMSAIIPFLKDE